MAVKPYYIKIKNILLNLRNGELSFHEIKELVTISRVIISSHLRYSRHSVLRLCNDEGITIEDLSIDCIADLFELDCSKRYFRLQNLISHMESNLESMPDVEYYLIYKAFLIKIAESQLARYYAQLDPNGYKINRNIKNFITSVSEYRLSQTPYGTILSFDINNNSADALPYYELDRLKTDFNKIAGLKNDIPTLMKQLHMLILGQTSFRTDLLLSDIVLLFKDYFKINETKQENDDHFLEFSSHLDDIELKLIKQKVITLLNEKIIIQYYAKNKLTRVQADILYSVMIDIIEDWIMIGDNNTLIKYFSKYSKTERDFYIIYKPKIEYLIKIAKNEFRLLLEIN